MITLKVPSIACESCANAVTQAIHHQDSQAQVTVEVATKIVTIDTALPESIVREAIAAVGHEIA